MKRITLPLFTMAWLACVPSAIADALQCGTDLVNVGDAQSDVLQKCGEPKSKDGNEWIYERPGDLTVIVQFAEGQVLNITNPQQQDP